MHSARHPFALLGGMQNKLMTHKICTCHMLGEIKKLSAHISFGGKSEDSVNSEQRRAHNAFLAFSLVLVIIFSPYHSHPMNDT